MEDQLSKTVELNNSTTNTEIKKLKVNVKNLVTRSHVDKVFNNKADEINKLSARVTKSEKTIEDNFNALNDEINRQTENVNSLEVCQEEIDCAMKKVNNLEGHVTNIENLMFCDISKGSKKIVFQWKLQNFQHYFDLGERVYSPMFYTQIKGYCFKMYVSWSGNNKENMLQLGLQLCRGSNYEKELEPFNMIFSLGIVDNNGVTKLEIVPLSTINKFRENSFTLSPGQNECKKGCGFDYSNSSLINNYISNDMLTMKCILTPLQ